MLTSTTQNYRRGATRADRVSRTTGQPGGESSEGTLESMLDSAASIAAQVTRYADSARRNARHVRPYFIKSFKKRPVMTVAGWFIVGFALGALWKK